MNIIIHCLFLLLLLFLFCLFVCCCFLFVDYVYICCPPRRNPLPAESAGVNLWRAIKICCILVWRCSNSGAIKERVTLRYKRRTTTGPFFAPPVAEVTAHGVKPPESHTSTSSTFTVYWCLLLVWDFYLQRRFHRSVYSIQHVWNFVVLINEPSTKPDYSCVVNFECYCDSLLFRHILTIFIIGYMTWYSNGFHSCLLNCSSGQTTVTVSYTHLTLRRDVLCRSRWSPYH